MENTLEDIGFGFEYAFTNAITQSCPLIIVEGKNDRPIYAKIAETAELINFEIFEINILNTKLEGCVGIIKLFQANQTYLKNYSNYAQFVLGIVDRDIRPYVDSAYFQEIKKLLGIFILEFYSIETYFANKFYLEKALIFATNLTKKDLSLSPEIIDWITTKQASHEELFYYTALEAMYAKEYPANTNPISLSDDKLKKYQSRAQHKDYLEARKIILDEYALSKNIQSKADLEYFCNGKWFMNNYFSIAVESIKELKNACKTKLIASCSNCKLQPTLHESNCLFMIKDKGLSETKIFEHIRLLEIDTVRFSNLIIAFKKLIS